MISVLCFHIPLIHTQKLLSNIQLVFKLLTNYFLLQLGIQCGLFRHSLTYTYLLLTTPTTADKVIPLPSGIKRTEGQQPNHRDYSNIIISVEIKQTGTDSFTVGHGTKVSTKYCFVFLLSCIVLKRCISHCTRLMYLRDASLNTLVWFAGEVHLFMH